MKTILYETARRWRLTIVCCAWMFTLLGLLMRGHYAAFLSANFLPVVALAIAALLPVAMSALLRPEAPRLGLREFIATAILLLPLLYIHQSKELTLGSQALSTRYVGSGPADAYSARSKKDGDATLLDLFLSPEAHSGKPVRVLGMLAKDNPAVRDLFGHDLPLAFRFAINCCAADAIPLALVMEGADVGALENDTWIEASGTFVLRDVGGQQLLVLENAVVQGVERPVEQYLYLDWGVF